MITEFGRQLACGAWCFISVESLAQDTEQSADDCEIIHDASKFDGLFGTKIRRKPFANERRPPSCAVLFQRMKESIIPGAGGGGIWRSCSFLLFLISEGNFERTEPTYRIAGWLSFPLSLSNSFMQKRGEECRYWKMRTLTPAKQWRAHRRKRRRRRRRRRTASTNRTASRQRRLINYKYDL